MFYAALVVFCSLFLTSLNVSADPKLLDRIVEPDPTYEFLESSYIAMRPHRRNEEALIFEADLAPHLLFLNTLDDLLAARTEGAFSLSLTARIRLRMVKDDSAPVRTPSYMPRLNGQYFRLFKRPTDSDPRFVLFGVRLSLGHHSNGQEFCPFEIGPKDGNCAPIDPQNLDLTSVNRRNGSFSYNHVSVEFSSKIGRVKHRQGLGGQKNPGWIEARTHSYQLLVNVLPPTFGPGAIQQPQQDLFGILKLRFTYVLELSFRGIFRNNQTRLRVRSSYEHTFGIDRKQNHLFSNSDVQNAANYIWTTTVAWSGERIGGLGMFVRFDRGRDYYNINFVDTIPIQVLLGVSVDRSGSLLFEL